MYPQLKYRDFNPERLVRCPVEQKQTKPKDGTSPLIYYEIPISYRYPQTDINGKTSDIIAPLLVESPILTSPEGITFKHNGNNITTSLPTTFDIRDPDVLNFIKLRDIDSDGKSIIGSGGFFEELYQTCLDRVSENSGNIPTLSRYPDLTTIFTSPISWYRNPSNGQIENNRNPKKYIPLVNYGEEGRPGYRITQFQSPIKTGKGEFFVHDWKTLSGVEIKYRGLLRIKKIYIGAKISIQVELESALVISTTPVNNCPKQIDTLKNAEKNDEIRCKIESQLKTLNLIQTI